MQPQDISQCLKQRAEQLGFSLCGICPAISPAGTDKLDQWLAAGYAGQMGYISERRAAYEHPRYVLDRVQSLIMLAMPYANSEPNSVATGQGRVSRYAWGEIDYHDLIRDRLHQLADALREIIPDADTRGVVDTAPLMERECAQLAGLGWAGKNTLLLSKHAGSYFFLAALLTDQVLEYDEPFTDDHCGTCTACLDACPTDAFPQPYVLDATRCISYLTIELQKPIPAELRAGMGDWLFGCDVCQQVCPWNRDVPPSHEPAFAPLTELNPVRLAELFELDETEFRRRFRHSPLWRAHRRGLLRNAAIVLGNQGDASALPALETGLVDDEPLVRGACAWALGELQLPRAIDLLQEARETEADVAVRQEIEAAIERAPR